MNDRAFDPLDDQPQAASRRLPTDSELLISYGLLRLPLIQAAIDKNLEDRDLEDDLTAATFELLRKAREDGREDLPVADAWLALGGQPIDLDHLTRISHLAALKNDLADLSTVASLAERIKAEAQRRRDDENGDDTPPVSEIELGQRFARQLGHRFRWSHGLDWLTNHGSHWERDEQLKRYTDCKAICRQAATEIDKPAQQAKLCSSASVSAVLNLARSEPEISTPVSEWDKHPMLINTPGGVFDLESGNQVSRNGLLFMQVAGVSPDFEMATPIWNKFLGDIFDGDQDYSEFIQRLSGYSITGSVEEQKLFFLHGKGANGKSVLLDVLQDISGRYGHLLPVEALMTAKHERHPTTFAALQGKRLAVSTEIASNQHWDESRLKSLTGDAYLVARFMRGDEFRFAVTHKHLLAGNHKPRLRGDDEAMERRMVLIPFNQQFTGARRDNHLRQKLKSEYPGILAWAIRGAAKWRNDGLMIPASVIESSQQYLADQNDIALWISECCIVNDNLRGKAADLYKSFAAFKQRNGENAGSAKDFGQRLERLHRKVKTKTSNVYVGLDVRPPELPDDSSGDYYGAREF